MPQKYPPCIALTADADIPNADYLAHYGMRAAMLAQLKRADLPVPNAWAFSMEAVAKLTEREPDLTLPMLPLMQKGCLMLVRSSAGMRDWGGPENLLNIGMNAKTCAQFGKTLGVKTAFALYFRFIEDFSVIIARLDSEDFENILRATGKTPDYKRAVKDALAFYAEETGAEFPQDPAVQLLRVMRSMAVAWRGTSAKILRDAQNAPIDAGLGLIVQEMVLEVGNFGFGEAQFISPTTGDSGAHGRFNNQTSVSRPPQNKDAQFLAKDKRGQSLQESNPQAFQMLGDLSAKARQFFRDDMRLDFILDNDTVWIVDARPAERFVRGFVASNVNLVRDGLRTKQQALLSLAPHHLSEILHPQISPKANPDQIAKGIGASPGAATGRIVFSASAAQACGARGEACILVRVETAPDDIRAMHSANGILTERGGITSHAAVVARGFGVPCVVGVSDLSIDVRSKTITLKNGEVLRVGDVLTIEGSSGQIFRDAPPLVEPELGGAFYEFMSWADEFRRLGVRCNADTAQEVRLAKTFGIDGLGLVRTEHMFLEDRRLTMMRELIFATTDTARLAALDLLRPIQQKDFYDIFALMGSAPVCIRLLDPPLHEFLPKSREDIGNLAESMDLPVAQVLAQIEDLREFNPMLGTRGVRLGIVLPDIYKMQAHSVFEAVAQLKKDKGLDVKPEIMIPLVSANREVALVKAAVESVAVLVRAKHNIALEYSLGVMVETPRAALRAGDIAQYSDFLSFGTNDLTQMTYGLSRDDSGRFMGSYLANKVFPDDPFHSLDVEGVGELMRIAVRQVRGEGKKDIVLGLCGEHGGNPESVAFCHDLGLDYVSCSTFRTPIARLAAAQAALVSEKVS
ncbi:MAG: putative PEP-binding protein [Candidatus Halichondribacter symbioticus]